MTRLRHGNFVPSLCLILQRVVKMSPCLFILITFTIYLRKDEGCQNIQKMIAKQVSMDNQCLVEYVRGQKIIPPSKSSYNLTFQSSSDFSVNVSDPAFAFYIREHDSPWVEALLAVEMFVPKRERRTFLECGALDGELFSTTLHLERFLNWTGVLIEADPIYFDRLKYKGRKAFSINACATGSVHPSKARFKHINEIHGITYMGKNFTVFNPGVGHLLSYENDITNSGSFEVEVECIPIYTILLGLEMTTIDLFVLDTEGSELEVLKTIPFDKVDISAFLVEIERMKEESKKMYRDFFEAKGYVFHGSYQGGVHPGDGLFLKKHLYRPELVKQMRLKDAYKIIMGERDESKIPKQSLDLFGIFFEFTSEYARNWD